ncbi:type IV secretory system conjugative DNA transfer family protein [Halobacterium hubeiense]|uniref:type IV secretory system conjugative DNA transfer family protein n=1 Tax=Halobacterium hubeiense TaxID=1407499 RepID=UPI0012F9824E|nr:type IV secretory system conjugative DNA transfer family protein [Halobacterium hubeiense]
MTGDQYAVTIEDVERAGQYEVVANTRGEGPVAGKKARRMFERAAKEPERPLWIGYDDTARNGFREAPVRFPALRRHLWVSGTTGAGKTTQLQNKAVQHAYAGHGFCNIDPKASGDTIELLQQLPEHRLDDVILLEPGSPEFEKTIGINMLDVPAIEDETRREKEIESRLENLVAIFDNDEYWGVNMQAVTESMGRAMLRRNAEISLDPDGDPSAKYSVIDMYFVLLNAERRANFAMEVDDPYLREFLMEIAEMDDDDLRPLTKRIKAWVENAIVRKIIARRESTIDWDEIVDDDLILLVRIPVDSEDIHQMISLSVLRNLWSAKKRQDRNPERETKPYFLQVDEFEKVANDNLAIEDMLVRARSMWLSVTLGTQYPGQIEQDHEGVMRAMENNCNTLLAMRTPGGDDAGILMRRFDGYSASDLMDTNYYRTWTKIPLEGGRESEPVNLKNFAPYPPLRSEEDVRDVIRDSLDQWGADPLSDAEIQRELKYGDYNEAVDPTAAPAADMNPDAAALDGDGVDVDDLPEDTILEGVYAAQVQHEDEETLVEASLATEEVEKRLGDTGYQSQLSNVYEELATVKRGRRSGEVVVGLTPEGRTRVFSADTGSSASGGGDDHRYILQESFRAFTRLGALTHLPTQEGEELPDGVADLPIDPLADAETVEDVHELEAELEREYPELYELAGARDIAIEAETSTIKKPMQTLTNLRKAIEGDRLCVFTCKDATASGHEITYWPRRGEQIIFDVEGGEIDYGTINCVNPEGPKGGREFYNKTSKYRLGEEQFAVQPATEERTELDWLEQDGEVIARVSNGYEAARFDSLDAVTNPSPSDVNAYRAKTDEGEWFVQEGSERHGPYPSLSELREDWDDLYAPFIPEHEFPREPTPEDFVFVVFPDDDNDEYSEPMLYEQGELRPLFSEDRDAPESSTMDVEQETSDEDTGEVEDVEAEASMEDREQGASGAGDSERAKSRPESDDRQPRPNPPTSEKIEQATKQAAVDPDANTTAEHSHSESDSGEDSGDGEDSGGLFDRL